MDGFGISGSRIKPGSRVGKGKEKAKPKAKTTATGVKATGVRGKKVRVPLASRAPTKRPTKAPAKVPVKGKGKKKKKADSKEENPVAEPTPPKEDVKGEVTVKWNHYEQKIEMINGEMSWKAFDEHFCLSFVYKKARYRLSTVQYVHEDMAYAYVGESAMNQYKGLKDGETYFVHIEEDEQEAATLTKNSKKYVPNTVEDEEGGEKKKVDEITQQLKAMSADELRNRGDKYKQLIEARDLEDCLYANV